MANAKPCRCPALPFPHRLGSESSKLGAACTPETRCEPDEDAADRWLADMIGNPRRQIREWAK